MRQIKTIIKWSIIAIVVILLSSCCGKGQEGFWPICRDYCDSGYLYCEDDDGCCPAHTPYSGGNGICFSSLEACCVYGNRCSRCK